MGRHSFGKHVIKTKKITWWCELGNTLKNLSGLLICRAPDQVNRPFPSYLLPLFQDESPCQTFLMKTSLIYMKMNLKTEHIFIRMVLHGDFNSESKMQLGIGLLR